MKKLLFLFVAAFVCALGANAEVWKKVTSAPADWSGKYLIACDNGEDWAVLDGSRSGDHNTGNLQSSFNYKPYDVNADGDIVLDACDYYVTIAKSGNAYTICTASGWYIGNNADSNTLGTTDNAEFAFLSTITLDAEQGAIITAVEGGSVLRYNHASGQDRFRYYKSSTYTNQQKIALYKLEEAQAPVDPVVPEIDGYEALSSVDQITAGTYVLFNRFGWGPCDFSSYRFTSCHNDAMDTGDNAVHNTIWIYDGEVNGSGLPTEFAFEPTSGGKFYLKDLKTGKYVNVTSSMTESDTPATEWFATLTDAEHRYFQLSYEVNGSQRNLGYSGNDNNWWPYWAGITGDGQPMRLYRKGGVNGGGETPVVPVEPTTTFKGEVVANLTSVSSLAELEGIQVTFVDAEQVNVLEDGDGIYVQSQLGDKIYAIWHPLLDGTYEINGNVVTLRNFYTDNSDGYFDELTPDVKNLYFEDYGAFGVSNPDAEWDGYWQTFSVAYEAGAVVAEPFDLVFSNNNVVCENGKTVEANEAGVATDFYLVQEGLTAVGNTATLYKDGVAKSFVMTFVDATAVSFFGGSSLMTEPGTYTLEVPAGTYTDAAGNPSNAFYGTWVLVQKDEPVEPSTKDKYTIKLSGTDYYFTTTEVKDNSVTTYSISATPEYFYIEPSGNGYTIKSADTDKWVGYDVITSWDFSNDEKVWQISSLEGEPTLIRKNSSKGFGVDNQFEGAGVYTDKSGQYWVIEKFVETEPEPTVWNGNVNYAEANSIEDLLDLTIEFEEASSVVASGYDVLAVVFDETGDAYGIVMGNGTFDVFGNVNIEGGKVSCKFQKISELGAAQQQAAKVSMLKIGGFQPTAGKAGVVFAGSSFVVDGELVADVLSHEYEFDGGQAPTSIQSVAAEAASTIFDLQGRRVNAAQKGIFIKNGVKVVK